MGEYFNEIEKVLIKILKDNPETWEKLKVAVEGETKDKVDEIVSLNVEENENLKNFNDSETRGLTSFDDSVSSTEGNGLEGHSSMLTISGKEVDFGKNLELKEWAEKNKENVEKWINGVNKEMTWSEAMSQTGENKEFFGWQTRENLENMYELRKVRFFSASNRYWTSTTYAPNISTAWIVNFNYGGVGNHFKTSNLYIRCVR